MKNKDLQNLAQGIALCGGLQGVKFAYALSRNSARIKQALSALEDAVQQSKEFKEYDKERVALNEKYAQRDEKGKVVIDRNQYVIRVVDRETFDKEIEELEEKYRGVVDARNKQIDEYNDLLEQESDFEPYKIKVENLPENISVQQLMLIDPLIEQEGV